MAANANQLLNSAKFFQLWRKKYSEAFKNSEKETPMSTSLEHESEQTKKLQWEKTKRINLISNSKMKRP